MNLRPQPKSVTGCLLVLLVAACADDMPSAAAPAVVPVALEGGGQYAAPRSVTDAERCGSGLRARLGGRQDERVDSDSGAL